MMVIAGQEPPSAALAADEGAPQGVVDEIEMSGVFPAAATDVLALDATDVFSADTTDVFSAAKAAEGGSCSAIRPLFKSKDYVQT